ncbi:MAG TPA: ECF-type sigma factor [Burkholderiaceae bacterium]
MKWMGEGRHAGGLVASRAIPLLLERKASAFSDIARENNFATTLVAHWRMNADLPITEILARASAGDSAAIDGLIPRIYATLHRLAHRQRLHEQAHTLDTTALVHEAWLQLADKGDLSFPDRAHLYAYVSRTMRHILVDHARRRRAQKRQAPLLTQEPAGPDVLDLLAIDQAMNRLAAVDERLARVAELRLFADLSSPEISEVLGVNARTVERDWLKARTFLSACLSPD